MSPNELRKYFNNEFEISKNWPKTYLIDLETYALCCQYIFDRSPLAPNKHGHKDTTVCLGENRGIIFKNVELIIERKR